MALIADGFTLLGSLKVPAVTGSATDAPMLIKTADFTTAMKADLLTNGNDLRLSSDIGGLTQLPIEVVDGLDVVWSRIPSVATDNLVYVWGDKPAAVKETDTAPFGRNAVYQDSDWYLGLAEASGTIAADSAGNLDGTYNGDLPNIGANGGQEFDGNDDYVSTTNTAVDFSAFTFSAKINTDNASNTQQIYAADRNNVGSGRNWQWRVESGKMRIICWKSGGSIFINTIGTETITSNQNHFVNFVFDGAAYKTYIDGALDLNLAFTDEIRPLTSYTPRIGAAESGSGPTEEFDGEIFYVTQESGSFKTPDQILIEYQNQSSATAWWIADDAGTDVTVPVTTVSATGSVGSVTVTAATSVTVPVTTVSATGSVGTVTVTADRAVTVPVTTVSATGSVGSVTVTAATSITVAVTTVSATGSVGSVTVTAARAVTVPVTTVSATGSVGTVSVALATSVTAPVTTVSATGSVGSVTVTAARTATVPVTTVSATGSVGTVTATAATSVTAPVTTVSATGSVGSVTVTAATSVTAPVTTVSATGSVGTVTVSAIVSAIAPVTTVSTTGSVGSVTVTADREAIVPVTTVSATGSVGTVTISIGGSDVPVTGVTATALLGNVIVSIPSRVIVMGTQCIVRTNSVNVWGLIDPNQTPNWIDVSDSQTPGWANINT